MKNFVASLGKPFEWVIIDTPPVMAVTDSTGVAHNASGVIFVGGSEMTSKGSARAALEQLDSVKAGYLGGILNRVDIRREYQSYYTSSAT